MVFEEIAASIIGGKVESCCASLIKFTRKRKEES